VKILTFSAYYSPEIAASMYLTEDILEAMAMDGNDIELFVPTPCRGIDYKIRKKYKHIKTETMYNGRLTIHRFSLFRERKNIFFRFFRYMLLILVFLWKGLRTDTDIIFAQSTPPIQGMMAGFLASVKKVPFVYNLQDIFPDSLVNSNITTKGSLMWKIGRVIEDYSYKKAEKIIVISDDFKKNLIMKGVSSEKIVVVPNWADLKNVSPISRKDNEIVKKYNLDLKKFYIVYSGNIGYTQNFDLLLNVASKVEQNNPEILFVLIGDGAAKKEICDRIEKEKRKNIIVLPFQTYENIDSVFSLGDVGLIISKPGVGNNSVPSKTWGIMAAERPILASFDEKSDLANLIKKINCGLVVNAGDEKKLYDAIKFLYENRKKIKCEGRNGRKYVIENLNKEKGTIKYLEILRGCFNE